MNINIRNTNDNTSDVVKVFNIGDITTTLQDLLDNTTIEIEKDQIVILKLDNGDSYLLPLSYDKTSIYGFGSNIIENDLIKLSSTQVSTFVQSVTGQYVDNTDPLNPILNDPRPYKVYTALINYISDGSPVFTVLENTLNTILTNTIVSPGDYTIKSSVNLPLNKTTITIGNINSPSNIGTTKYLYTIMSQGVNYINIQTYQSPMPTSPWNKSHYCFTNNLFEIRVYN